MKSTLRTVSRLIGTCLLAAHIGNLQSQTIAVVDIIPVSASTETYQDSEPTLAVQANGNNLAASAITNGPSVQGYAPIYISQNRGTDWTRLDVVPIGTGTPYPFVDPSLSFTGSGELYVAVLQSTTGEVSTFPLSVLRKIRFADANERFVPFGAWSRVGVDQPHLKSIRDGASGKEVMFVALNDDTIDNRGRTATIDQYVDPPGRFERTRIEARRTATRDGAPVRVAVTAARTYGTFFARRQIATGCVQRNLTDLVLVRDDQTGTMKRTFSNLTSAAPPLNPPENPTDTRGMIVRPGFFLPRTKLIGQDRIGYDLAIAATSDGQHVYLAWAEVEGPCNPTQETYRMKVWRSTTGGTGWSVAPGFTSNLVNAKNPSLAINSDGTVALLYQRLVNGRWQTTVERVKGGKPLDNTPIILADTNAALPTRQYQPYLGDYTQMVAVGASFYGIFSASNDPAQSVFPKGIRFLRKTNCSFVSGATCKPTTLKNDAGTTVSASIDPFFFRIDP